MNFLLYMLGRIRRTAPGLRPTLRQLLLVQANASATLGQWKDALAMYRRLDQVSDAFGHEGFTPVDLLIRGQLAFMAGEREAAARDWSIGIERLWWPDENADCSASDTVLESWFQEAQGQLRAGRYVRAADLLDRARARIEILLSAHAGLMLLDEKVVENQAADACAKLVHLSDLALRFMVRIQVSSHLADSLRERCLRSDLAGWATTLREVDALLEAEYHRLAGVADSLPAHVETQYRLARAARLTGRLEEAVAAFGRVLAIHPHHISSAIRRAVTLVELGRPEHATHAVGASLRVTADAMKRFNSLAQAAVDHFAFDRSVQALLADSSVGPEVVRGNLAFALTELSLLNDAHAHWREPATV